MVIPHVTQCYGDSQDPEEQAIPMCTIRNFPSEIEHCIEWGRVKFDSLFVERPNEITKYIENSELFLKKAEDGSSSETRARLFLTDAEDEFRYLKLSGDLKTMTSNMELYNVLTSTSGTSALHDEI